MRLTTNSMLVDDDDPMLSHPFAILESNFKSDGHCYLNSLIMRCFLNITLLRSLCKTYEQCSTNPADVKEVEGVVSVCIASFHSRAYLLLLNVEVKIICFVKCCLALRQSLSCTTSLKCL